MEEQKVKVIDIGRMIRMVLAKRRRVITNLVIALVVSVIWIFPEPRYYTCDVQLAPEQTNEISGGSLSALASSFGVNLGGMQSNDAIYPMLYPDLFESPEFLVGLFDVQVETEDGSIKTDYYTYLTKHQKKNWLTLPFKKGVKAVKDWIKPKAPNKHTGTGAARFDAFNLSEDDYLLMQGVKEKITCSVDKKTDVTTILVKDQDRKVCALMADSVRARLQTFITHYRTSKARLDLDYYESLVEKAHTEYEAASAAYSRYTDTHKDVILQAYISERDALENEMSIRFNTYNAMTTQLEAAKAKVQERTPSFTTLKSASMPVKPAGPKRMIFVLGMMFLTFVGTSLWICRGNIINKDTTDEPKSEEAKSPKQDNKTATQED